MALIKDITLAVLGSTGVGKSCLCYKYCQGIFVEEYSPTLEEHYTKLARIDNCSVLLRIIDTAGYDGNLTQLEILMKTVGYFFLVFDVSRRNSLQELIAIRERLIAGKTETPWMLLIGNKADLEETREVKREEAEELAAGWNSRYIEVSVKNGNNINQCFLEVIREALKSTKIQSARHVKNHKCCILM